MSTYRFSDLVKGARTTPKSLRRWFVTLDRKPPEGQWHSFRAIDVMHYATMRHLVDWGVSVPDADWMAFSALVDGLTDYDRATDLPHWQLVELAKKHDIYGGTVADLFVRLRRKRLLVFRREGEVAYVLQTEHSPPPAEVWSAGSFLGVDFYAVAGDVMNALDEADVEGGQK